MLKSLLGRGFFGEESTNFSHLFRRAETGSRSFEVGEGAVLIGNSANILESRAQMTKWIKKIQRGESLKDQRGVWNRKYFSSLEKENAYWKVQVEWLKSASKFTREGVILKSEKFLIMDKLRKKHPFAWLF